MDINKVAQKLKNLVENDEFINEMHVGYPQVSLKGRPSVMTKSVVGKLRTAFLMGCSDREACAYAQINKDTLYDFQKKNPEFSDQKELWKQNPILKARITVFKSLNQPKIAMWYLERKKPEEFSLRYHTSQSSTQLTIQYVIPKTNYEDMAKKAEEALNLQESEGKMLGNLN